MDPMTMVVSADVAGNPEARIVTIGWETSYIDNC